jgi:hypothetical protein
VVSVMITLKLHCEELPAASVAVSVTLYVPTLRLVPAAGDCVTLIEPAIVQLSATEASAV